MKTPRIYTSRDAATAREASDTTWIDWLEKQKKATAESDRIAALLAANPRIGVLIREGEPVYYIADPAIESPSIDALIARMDAAPAEPVREIVVEIREQYGRQVMHPRNNAARIFAQLAGTTTITTRTIDTALALGFTVREVHGRELPR